MNRCTVCDKTDEDDPKAAITIQGSELHCLECRTTIADNLEDLSVNDTIEIDYFEQFIAPLEQDGDWLTSSVPSRDLSEQ